MDFDWDEGDRDKNLRHGVHDWEIEEAFFDSRKVYAGMTARKGERRRILLGRAATSGKYLRVVFTVRMVGGRQAVRPISAIEMTGADRRLYRRG